MIFHIIRLKIISTLIFLLFSNVSFADLKICNNSNSKDINVSLAIIDDKNKTSFGWVKIKNGDCLNSNTNFSSDKQYFYYARSFDKTTYWESKSTISQRKFCVDERGAFTIRKHNRCETRGLETRFFQEIIVTDPNKVELSLTGGKQKDYNTGAIIGGAAIIGGILYLLNEANNREEEECMRQCTKSRTRCLQLCTR